MQMHAKYITFDGFGAVGHSAVDPGGDGHLLATRHIPAKTGRNFQRQADVTAAHTPVDVLLALQRGFFDKIAGTGEVQHIVLAQHRLVLIQHGKTEIFHVHRDAKANKYHQHQTAQQGQRGADRVPPQLQRFALTEAPQALPAESPLRCSCVLRYRCP